MTRLQAAQITQGIFLEIALTATGKGIRVPVAVRRIPATGDTLGRPDGSGLWQ
jgi:hypothetical protein